jgi:hypothetical protein
MKIILLADTAYSRVFNPSTGNKKQGLLALSFYL